MTNIISKLWKSANVFRLRRYDFQSGTLGLVDITFFYLAFSIVSFNIFPKISSEILLLVGGWITIKSLPAIWKSKVEQEYYPYDKKRIPGTGGERYNIYLIGTALNIIIAINGVFLANSLTYFVLENNYLDVIIENSILLLAFILPILLILLYCWIKTDLTDDLIDNKGLLNPYFKRKLIRIIEQL